MVRQSSNSLGSAEVFPSTFCELVLTVLAHQHPLRWDTLSAGTAERSRIERGMSPELRGVLADLDLTGRRAASWEAVVGWAWRRGLAPADRGVAAVSDAPDADAELWLAPLPEAERPELAWFRDHLALALRLWHRDLFAPREAEIAREIEADADLKRRLASELPASELVEVATNGLVWTASPAVAHAVLVPSLVLRPWVNDVVLADAVIFAYPAAAADVAAGDGIVRLARVLGDETRMATIRLLADREWTLQELAEHLGLRKSTMHHHLAQLRAAGLLRVRFNTKSYTLRRRPLEELGIAVAALGRET